MSWEAENTEWQFTPCHYCGCIADTIDHFPPTTVFLRMRQENPYLVQRRLPCCRECNVVLGARAPFDLAERKRLVKQALRRRHGALLRIPDWTQKALAELEPTLREFYEKGLRDKETLRERLAW